MTWWCDDVFAVMKRRAAEIAAIKLCKSSFDSKPFSSRSQESRTSLADKSPEKRDRSSSKDKAREQKDDVTSQTLSGSRTTVKHKSAGAEDSVDRSRRSSLRSSHPQTPPDSRSVTSKRGSRKRTEASIRQSASSSETDTEINDSTDTQVSQPVKQSKIGITAAIWCFKLAYLMYNCICKTKNVCLFLYSLVLSGSTWNLAFGILIPCRWS